MRNLLEKLPQLQRGLIVRTAEIAADGAVVLSFRGDNARGDAELVEVAFEPVRLRLGVFARGDVKNEERWDALVLREVGDGRDFALRGFVSAEDVGEYLRDAVAVAVLDPLRDGVGGDIERHTSLEHVHRHALGFQITIIRANQRGEMCTRGVAHDDDRVRIASMLCCVLMHPEDGFCDVAHHVLQRHRRQESVVHRHEHAALIDERLRLFLQTRLVARFPAATVNPNDDRMILPILWRINIERLQLVFRVCVKDVALNLRFGGECGSDEQQQKQK